MTPSFESVTITTPKGYLLFGLWAGSPQAKRVLIVLHGLGANLFALQDILAPLATTDTALLFFNNRGHDDVSSVRKIDKRKAKGYTSVRAGAAHEVFTQCEDDIQGAINLATHRGVQLIVLVGHSTGCQKSAYYLRKQKNQHQVHGVTYLCPMSDLAGMEKIVGSATWVKAHAEANKLIRSHKAHSLLPQDIWPALVAAQRFTSLYSPAGPQETLSFPQPRKIITTLRNIKIPSLVILAGRDEYRDRPIKHIAQWFINNFKSNINHVAVLSQASHNLAGHESEVRNLIQHHLR